MGSAGAIAFVLYAAQTVPAQFRRVMTILTLVWGIGLLASSGLACVLVFTLSIHDYIIVSPFVGYGSMGALGLWTVWYGRRAQRRAHLRESLPPMPVR